MKNRYLFRGKQIDNEKWIFGNLVQINSTSPLNKEAPPMNYIWEIPYTKTLKPIDATTIGQCIGLKDENGKLIFEGDIVKLFFQDNRGNDYDEILIIEWNEEICGFVGMREEFKENNIYAPLTSHDRIEVLEIEIIGNIYENFELLKKH